MAEAILLVPDAVLVVLGFGRGWDASVARDADPRFAGRHFTLPAVHPDELVSWIASADVAMVTLPPLSYNQRYTTPNKFLEALAAGTPIVLGPDLPTMAGILEREDAGRIAASMAPEAIAAAIRSILDAADGRASGVARLGLPALRASATAGRSPPPPTRPFCTESRHSTDARGLRHDAAVVAHVVGARPNFMKAAPVIRALAARGVDQRLIHTGQHYDDAMSAVFFRDLDLPRPDLDLGVGSGSHAAQTAAIMVALERAFAEIRPALAVVYGDVNSTVAAALVAAKIGLPMAHVEAGLRSFDDTMPEEINRRVTDLLSRAPVRDEPRGRRQPRGQRDAGPADPLRRQPDDRHAADASRAVRRRADADGAGPPRALRGGHHAPPVQR